MLRWRYGDQLRWRLVVIGLAERSEQYVARGYTPARSARGHLRFRRYGMPFAPQPRPRVAATGPACRAIVAARLRHPGREHAVLRALQFAWFTTALVLDEAATLREVLEGVAGIDAAAIVAAVDDTAVIEAYEADRALARTAAGSPTELQGKAARTDGPVRYTAPSLVFAAGEARLEAGGFQPVEAYDVLVANLEPALARRPAPDDPLPALGAFPEGLATAEVAAIMARGNEAPDPAAAEAALIELAADRVVARDGLGDSALWRPAAAAAELAAQAA